MTSQTYILMQLVCIFVVMATVNSKLKVLPASSYFSLCSRADQKELNECVKKTVMTAKKILKDGIPALGLVPLEPLVIPKMELVQGVGTFALKTTLSNFTIKGLINYEVTDANLLLDDKTFAFNLTTFTPETRMTADYEMDGQILVIPIRGKGNCEMNFTDLVTTSRTTGRVVEINGEKHIEVVKVMWDISVNHEKSHSWFYNLFNGDKRLGDATNNFLNENNKEAFDAIKHLPQEAFGEVFKDMSSKVYRMYPIKDLFLD